ncbi:MAG: MsnO8 family LLM class oxidoreductase [Nocardioides sp.]|nr:MsnO8 family LLM class oxidoreductase [Nocardioides sp.]
MKLSLLDRSRTRAGETDGAALRHSVDRAVAAEAAGYHRFWVAEHHAVPGIASGAPGVLLAAVGAATSTIRLGSGGVMLPHHQPLVVAEQFLMLEALYAGRVDVGLGRSPAFTAPVRAAMREDSVDSLGGVSLGADSFEADLAELRSYFDGTAAVTARPAADTSREPIPMFVLATGKGIEVAARGGFPVVLGGPVLDRPGLADLLSAYRRDFRPHAAAMDAPRVTVSLDVTIAGTDAEARELALPEAWAMARARQSGSFPALESIAAIRDRHWSRQVTERVERSLDRAVAGTAGTVRRRLEEIAERTGAEELLASTSTFDREALLASDRELARLLS